MGSPSQVPALTQQSSQKKQKTIASFFTPRPAATNATSEAKRSEPPRDQNAEKQANEANDLFVSDDEEASGAATRFSSALKRAASRDDDVDPAPARKRSRKSPTPPSPEAILEDERTSLTQVSANAVGNSKKVKATARTSKYMFSKSDPAPNDENEEEGEDSDASQVRKTKAELHEKFVKKLGGPRGWIGAKRRHAAIEHEAEEGEEDQDEDGEDDDEEPAAKSRGRNTAASGSSKAKLTPLMQQVVDLKKKHPDTMLVVESGYKYHIYGEEARSASKLLSLVCIPGRMRFDDHPAEAHLKRFAKLSFPVERLHVHVRRLVRAGFKVGIVRQLETRALKAAGKNKSKIFERGLTDVYTKGTYIDDPDGLDESFDGESGQAPATGHLLCLTETSSKGVGSDEKVNVGIVTVQPATGDIIYDDFVDEFMRSELETRLLHISPCEVLIVGELSRATEKLIQHLCGGDDARIERVDKPKTMVAQSYTHITKFYADKVKENEPSSSQVQSSQGNGTLLDKIHKLSENATVCLSAMITHLTDYNLQHVFDLTTNFQSFSTRSHMLLNGNTLTSLEIFRNQTDLSQRGSLFWALDRTKTRFGQRLLRKWVGRPLLDRTRLDERTAAIEELKDAASSTEVNRISQLLSKTRGDLEKTLIRIYYKKCSREELLGLLQTLQKVSQDYAHIESQANAGFKSRILNEAIAALPGISDDVVGYLERINAHAVERKDKYGFFREEHETDDITNHKMGIVAVEHDLNEFKQIAAAKLKRKRVDYITVAGIEFLIELENTQIKNVPASWIKVSGTKKMARYHAPEVVSLMRERDQHKESLSNACDAAFTSLLNEIGSQYQAFRDCIQSLAMLDCLLSLAEVASQPGYCKPSFSTTPGLSITAGRHPMVEQLLLDSFVPNDIHLTQDGTRALCITGPNMGGKSSYVRSVALIAIMAQVGSYVPAAAAELGLLDAVFTRMGAFDNVMKGESTFMVELGETAEILKHASPRSLVILDELGRGTSTHDGVAIAHAVLRHVVDVLRPFTLFITHYQSLAHLADQDPAGALRNVHMRFTEHDDRDAARAGGEKEITFLYEVGDGVAHRSYGLNVARLAGLPPPLLEEASRRSSAMEQAERARRLRYLSRSVADLMRDGDEDGLAHLVAGIEQL